MKLLQHWKDELLELVNSKNQLTLTEQDVTFEFIAKDDATDVVSVRIKPLEGSPYFNEQTLVYVRRDLTKNFTGIPLRFIVNADTTIGAVVDQLAARYGVSLDKTVDFLEADLQTAVTFEDSGVKELELNVADASYVWAGKLKFTVANDTLDLVTIIAKTDLYTLNYLHNSDSLASLSLLSLSLDWDEIVAKHNVATMEIGAAIDDALRNDIIDRLVSAGGYDETTRTEFATLLEYAYVIAVHDLDDGYKAVHLSTDYAETESWAGDVYLRYHEVVTEPEDFTYFTATVQPGALDLSVISDTFDVPLGDGDIPLTGGVDPELWYRLSYDNVKVDVVEGANTGIDVTQAGRIEIGWKESGLKSLKINLGGNALLAVLSFGKQNDVRNWSFERASNLTSVPAELPTAVTSTNSMFLGCSKFNDPNVIGWDMSNVTNADRMFRSAVVFNQNIGSWNMSNIVSMRSMFEDAKAFNQDISGWNVAQVTEMVAMFWQATSFNQNLSGWNVSNVTEHADFDTGATAWEASNKPTFAA